MPHGSRSPVVAAGRYVVLRHEVAISSQERLRPSPEVSPRGDHFDWMFEVGEELLTWACEEWLSPTDASDAAALHLPPHRLAYLDYEGEVSGDRGTVRRVEAGTHRLLQAAEDRYLFAVQGGRTGTLTFYRTASSAWWTMAFAP